MQDVTDLRRKYYEEDFYTDLLKSQELLNIGGYNTEILPADDILYENVEGSDLQI